MAFTLARLRAHAWQFEVGPLRLPELRGSHLALAYLGLVVVAFAFFYPLWTGLPLTGDGWLTAVKQSDDAWLVVSTRVRALTPELVRETRTRFETLAGEHGGLYDGWEART